MRQKGISWAGWMMAVALLQTAAWAQQGPSAWVIGGKRGEPWSAVAWRWIALEDTTRPGALQPIQIPPDLNVLGERVRTNLQLPRNLFGYKWSTQRSRYGMEVDTLLIGWHPRIWRDGSATALGVRTLIDGDEMTVAFTHAPATAGARSEVTWWTLDLGVPVPIDSVVFFPPQFGMTSSGQLLRTLSPEAYEVTRTNEVVEWLLFEDEATATGSNRYHPLKEVLGSTFSNNQSIVGLKCPLRFTRFLRFKFGGVRSTGVISEIKAFGRGFPQEGRFISQPHSFGLPVSFGKVTWKFTKYRLDAAGQIAEDPNAPVTLTIRTRSGTDADPQAYFVYDELGRRVEVDQETYYKASPPKGSYEDGLPDFRAALTDDIENWNAWSIAYQQSGDEIRSADGRQYFQFRVEIATEDPLAFGVLDSLAFEISPLLADSVLAEISLAGQPTFPGQPVEVSLGTDTTFVYDLRTVLRDPRKPGFDALELEVPVGTQFLDLEIDGQPAVEGRDYSLLPEATGRLGLAFPQRFRRDTSIRLRFRSAIFHPSVFFGGHIFDRTSGASYLPQSIEAGDARPEVASNLIQVVATQSRLKVLGALFLSPPVLTPNGDAINDEIAIAFDILGVEEALLKVEIYDLSGRLVARISEEKTGAGRHRPIWDGRGTDNELVPPGIYLVGVQIDVDEGVFTRLVPVSVAY